MHAVICVDLHQFAGKGKVFQKKKRTIVNTVCDAAMVALHNVAMHRSFCTKSPAYLKK
jgi:hypothetical protein